MKRSVGDIEFKLLLALAVVFFPLIMLTEPFTALLIVLAYGFIKVSVMIEERPPDWLLRSPLGGWVRRYSGRRR